MPRDERPLYAVLIDADNISPKYAEPVLKEVASFGEPALRRVYGDWSSSQLKNWSKKIRVLGLVAHQETANTDGKNASDIGLVIDAMDILYTGRFDGFVLVSSDSDFTRLASRIREEGLDVIGIGAKKSPASLTKACNRFIFLENLEEPESTEKSGGSAAEGKENPTKAMPLILQAMDQINSDDEWYLMGQLGQAIIAEKPDFDTRTYGEKKLSDLINKLKRFETKKQGNQLVVRRLD